MKLHTNDCFNLQCIERRFRQLTDHIGHVPLPSPWNNDNRKNTSLGTLATLPIPRAVSGENPAGFYRAGHRRKNERRDKSSGWRARACDREDTGRHVRLGENLLPIFFFLRPENGIEFTCRVSAAEFQAARREKRAGIYLCATHAAARPRVRNIERNNPAESSPAKRIPFQDPIYSRTAKNPLEEKSPTSGTPPKQFIQVYIVARNFGAVCADRAICDLRWGDWACIILMKLLF